MFYVLLYINIHSFKSLQFLSMSSWNLELTLYFYNSDWTSQTKIIEFTLITINKQYST